MQQKILYLVTWTIHHNDETPHSEIVGLYSDKDRAHNAKNEFARREFFDVISTRGRFKIKALILDEDE